MSGLVRYTIFSINGFEEMRVCVISTTVSLA